MFDRGVSEVSGVPRGKVWPVVTTVYWCPNCNVPLLEPRCYKCGGKGFKLSLHEPGDARPALNGDMEHLKEGIKYDFGDLKLFEKLGLGNSVILLNKVTYFDLMREVVANGNIVGKMFFDPFKKRWRFKLSYYSAKLCVEEGICEVIEVDSKVRGLERIPLPSKLPRDKQVVIVNKDHDPIAIGLSRGKYVSVRTIFKNKSIVEVNSISTTMDDVLKANELPLHNLASRSLKLLYVMANKVRKPVLISYSGGKDSLVSLHLTLRLGIEGDILFNDTGIELPETIKAVYEVVDKYGLKLHVASAGEAFWKGVEVFGPPARDYRWCCKVVKLVPLARLTKSLWPNGALNIVGQRAYESLDRAKTPQVWRNKWVPHLLSITLIQYWNQLAIWMYIFKHKLSYNKLYDEGFDRIGCYLCPASYLAEFNLIEKNHPNEWCRWCEVLNRWKERLGYPDEWVEYGLWRWLGPSNAKDRYVKKLGVEMPEWYADYEARSRLPIVKVDVKPNEVTIGLGRELSIEGVKVQYTAIIKDSKILDQGDELVIQGPDVVIHVAGRVIKASSQSISKGKLLEYVFDVLKTAYRWENCVRCGSCVMWCPTKSIRLSPKPTINPESCTGCKVCIDVCPLADLMVEKTIITRALNNPFGWKRSTKRKREDLVKYLKSVYGTAT